MVESRQNESPLPGTAFAAKIEKFDAGFARWKAQNPTGRFSDYATMALNRQIERGVDHATLGSRLKSGNDWRTDGLDNFRLITERIAPGPAAKICDYGCGTLRVGVHVIERQDRGCYFGMDVSDYLLAEGLRLVGNDLLDEKRPVIGTIDATLATAIAAGVDLVFSFNVASHIHPDEQRDYTGNLLALCHRPGARLLLNVVTHAVPVRFQPSGWAWTLDHYRDWLSPLALVDTFSYGRTDKDGIAIDGHLLTFERR
jgi:SAM-dependent methyltransferase